MATKWTYRDYTGEVDAKTAQRILAGVVVAFLGLEVLLRVLPIHYSRPSGNSMHGIRPSLMNADEDPKPKLLFVGESTVVGGGVADGKLVFPSLARAALRDKFDVYNLGVPGGNTITNCITLESALKLNIPNIRRVVIEVPAIKLFAVRGQVKSSDSSSIEELLRFLPDGDVEPAKEVSDKFSLSERVENDIEFDAARYSKVLRNRDAVKAKISGGFPAFWVANLVLPASLKVKMFAKGADGNNRLAANPEDGIYKGPTKDSDKDWEFETGDQFHAVELSIEIAKKCSQEKPIILVGPLHYEFDRISDRERTSILGALQQMKSAMDALCLKDGADLVWTDSTKYQEPDLWTRSQAHYRPALHEIVWQELSPLIQ